MSVSFFAWGASGFMGEALRRLMDERLSQGSRDALGTSTRRTTGVAFFAMGVAFLAAFLAGSVAARVAVSAVSSTIGLARLAGSTTESGASRIAVSALTSLKSIGEQLTGS